MFAVEVYGILHINNKLNNAGAVLFIQKLVMSVKALSLLKDNKI